jgi:hypothetical protein
MLLKVRLHDLYALLGVHTWQSIEYIVELLSDPILRRQLAIMLLVFPIQVFPQFGYDLLALRKLFSVLLLHLPPVFAAALQLELESP